MLPLLANWAKENSLVINTDKTKVILFRPKNKNVSSPTLTLDTNNIEVVTTMKVLGVYFNYNLTWDHHISEVHKKLCRTIGLINRHRFTLPECIKLLLYNSLILPHLSYAHLVWGSTTKTNVNRLLTLQKKVLRIIANIPYHYHTKELFTRFRIVNILNLYDFRLPNSYRVAVKNRNSFFSDLAKLTKNVVAYRTRFPSLWYTPTPHNNYCLQSITYNLLTLLNKYDTISVDIYSLPSKKLKSLFIS